MNKKVFKAVLLCVSLLLVTACSRNKTKEFVNDNIEGRTTEKSESKFEDNEVVIVYFSATGTTRNVAMNIKDILSADIYEIVPAIPYTQEDLTYYTNSRADKEQADVASRPAIAEQDISISDYDVILLGYPIWHGQAPRIIDTFLETYDFSNKTIIPFCTSHSSDIGSSAINLQSLTSNTTTWLEGRRFNSSVKDAQLKQWLQEYTVFNIE